MKQSHIKNIIKLLITFGILYFIFNKFDLRIQTIWYDVIHGRYLLFALIIPFLLQVISVNRWGVFLNQLKIRESKWLLFKINCVSTFQSLILPSSQGLDFLRVYYIEKRNPDKLGQAGSTVILERLFGFIILAVLSFVFAIFSTSIPNKKQVILITGLILIILLIVIFILTSTIIQNLISKIKTKNHLLIKVQSFIINIFSSLSSFPYKKILLSSISLILLFQISTILSVYLIFNAYGYALSLSSHIVLYPIISIFSMIPITISGFGIREGFFVYFYSFLGVPSEISIAVSLVNYFILTLTPAIIGALFYIISIIKNKSVI